MVDMLKKMHMPTTFMSPSTFNETSVDNFTTQKRNAEMSMAMSGISKNRVWRHGHIDWEMIRDVVDKFIQKKLSEKIIHTVTDKLDYIIYYNKRRM